MALLFFCGINCTFSVFFWLWFTGFGILSLSKRIEHKRFKSNFTPFCLFARVNCITFCSNKKKIIYFFQFSKSKSYSCNCAQCEKSALIGRSQFKEKVGVKTQVKKSSFFYFSSFKTLYIEDFSIKSSAYFVVIIKKAIEIFSTAGKPIGHLRWAFRISYNSTL